MWGSWPWEGWLAMKLSVAPISRTCRPWNAGWRGGGIGRNHRTVSLRDKTKRLMSLESSPPGRSWLGTSWTQFLAPRGLDPRFRGCRNWRFAGMGQHGGCRRRDNMGFPTMGQPGVRLRSPTKGCPYDKRNTNAHRQPDHRHHNPARLAALRLRSGNGAETTVDARVDPTTTGTPTQTGYLTRSEER